MIPNNQDKFSFLVFTNKIYNPMTSCLLTLLLFLFTKYHTSISVDTHIELVKGLAPSKKNKIYSK